MSFRNEIVSNIFVEKWGTLWQSEDDVHPVKPPPGEAQKIESATLWKTARAQGVVPQVYHSLKKLKTKGFKAPFLDPFLDHGQKYLEGRKEYTDKLFNDLEAFAKTATAIGVRSMVVKGGCLLNLYPNESFRMIGDIDLIISKDTSWEGLEVFKQIRYRPKRIRLEKYALFELGASPISDGTFGIAEMLDLDGDMKYCQFDLHPVDDPPFDLHLGAFPGCGDSILEANLWSRAIPLNLGSSEILMPSFEDCILIICSHISRHGYARLRDLNDIYVCLKHAGGNFDWDYLCQFTRKNVLQTILYSLLNFINKTYRADIPEEVLTRLKPNIFYTITSKRLFHPGTENPKFHGDRQLIFGRLLQAAFLYHYYSHKADFLSAFKESLSGLYFLFQSGRPYHLWQQREIQPFSSNRRIVIVPIEAIDGEKYWQIEHISIPAIQKFALNGGIPIERINDDIIIWNVGHSNELLFTPYQIYTQSAYSGNLGKNTLKKLQQIAWEVTSILVEEKAISANCIMTSDLSLL